MPRWQMCVVVVGGGSGGSTRTTARKRKRRRERTRGKGQEEKHVSGTHTCQYRGPRGCQPEHVGVKACRTNCGGPGATATRRAVSATCAQTAQPPDNAWARARCGRAQMSAARPRRKRWPREDCVGMSARHGKARRHCAVDPPPACPLASPVAHPATATTAAAHPSRRRRSRRSTAMVAFDAPKAAPRPPAARHARVDCGG